MMNLRRARRRLAALTLAVALPLVAAPPTLAAVNQFMSYQSLGAGNAYASSLVKRGISQVDGVSNHTWCPALAQGYQGYTSSPNSGGNWTPTSTLCGTNYQYWRPNGTANIYFRGAAVNPNSVTSDYFNYAEFFYP